MTPEPNDVPETTTSPHSGSVRTTRAGLVVSRNGGGPRSARLPCRRTSVEDLKVQGSSLYRDYLLKHKTNRGLLTLFVLKSSTCEPIFFVQPPPRNTKAVETRPGPRPLRFSPGRGIQPDAYNYRPGNPTPGPSTRSGPPKPSKSNVHRYGHVSRHAPKNIQHSYFNLLSTLSHIETVPGPRSQVHP